MKVDGKWRFRLAILTELVRRSSNKLGRTALMKLAYLLQVVRGVPLGYRFELYNYGPYDSTVLGDLSEAVTLKILKSEPVQYPNGYGYEYSIATSESEQSYFDPEGIDSYLKDVDWVIDKFGNSSASRLELISTIVFAEREMRRKKQVRRIDELERRVLQIKPHFSDRVIHETVAELGQSHLIDSPCPT